MANPRFAIVPDFLSGNLFHAVDFEDVNYGGSLGASLIFDAIERASGLPNLAHAGTEFRHRMVVAFRTATHLPPRRGEQLPSGDGSSTENGQ